MDTADPPAPGDPVLQPALLPDSPLPESIPVVLPFRRPRWRTLAAWVVILAIVGGLVQRTMLARKSDSTTLNNLQDQAADFSFRYMVGTYEFVRALDPTADAKIYNDTKAAMSAGPLSQQLRFVVLAGELKGPGQALTELAELKAPEAAPLVEILTRLYRDYERKEFTAPSVSGSERDQVRAALGWVGELALHPAGTSDTARRAALLASAQRTFFTVIIAFLGCGFFGLAGLPCLLTVLILARNRRLLSGLGPPSGTGGLYAETFALWLVLFVGLNVLLTVLPLPGLPLAFKGAGFLFTLVVLVWPVLWGVPWQQVRAEVGLTWGRRPWLEPFLGVFTYLSCLPLMSIGLLLTILLMKAPAWFLGDKEPVAPPYHPIAEGIGQADWWQLLQLVFLASVVAPIVEETVFRGLLYRHLREATGKWAAVGSMLVSATVVSFLFAVIHPQGWLGIPVLMSIAYGLTIAREWRGTLLPAMIAHGLNNFIALLVSSLLFRA